MRVLLDVNVVLDVLASREPFVADSHAVFQLIEAGAAEGLLAAHSLTTVQYLLARHLARAKARKTLEDLLHLLDVVAVDEDRFRHALAMNWKDFEDAVQASCAERAEADYPGHARQTGIQAVGGSSRHACGVGGVGRITALERLSGVGSGCQFQLP